MLLDLPADGRENEDEDFEKDFEDDFEEDFEDEDEDEDDFDDDDYDDDDDDDDDEDDEDEEDDDDEDEEDEEDEDEEEDTAEEKVSKEEETVKSSEEKTAEAEAPTATPAAVQAVPEEEKLTAISPEDIPLSLVVEVGRLKMSLQTLMDLKPGNTIELDVMPENGIDLVVNGSRVAKGELLKVGENLGIRILELG